MIKEEENYNKFDLPPESLKKPDPKIIVSSNVNINPRILLQNTNLNSDLYTTKQVKNTTKTKQVKNTTKDYKKVNNNSKKKNKINDLDKIKDLSLNFLLEESKSNKKQKQKKRFKKPQIL